jgi:pseudouridine kinase
VSVGIDRFRSVTVFGGATMDHAAATANLPILGASNPGTARTSPGGVGLNVARDLARLGLRVRLVTRVGADHEGEAIIAAAAADGVESSSIGVVTGSRTATYRAAFDNEGGLIVGIADMDIFDDICPAVVRQPVEEAPAGEIFVIDANLPAPTLAFIVEAASAAGHQVAAIAVSPAKAVRLTPLLRRIALLFATRREAAAVLGRTGDPAVATSALAEMLAGVGVPNVVVTDSADPLAAASDGALRSFVPFPAVARSVNGAGDALAAGTLYGLALGGAFFDAVMLGLGAAAITVEDDGTVAAGLNAVALEARLAATRIQA